MLWFLRVSCRKKGGYRGKTMKVNNPLFFYDPVFLTRVLKLLIRQPFMPISQYQPNTNVYKIQSSVFKKVVSKKVDFYKCFQHSILLKSYDKCLTNATALLHSLFYRSSIASNIYFRNILFKLITKFDSSMRLNLYKMHTASYQQRYLARLRAI